jgi:hypothetical protein
MCDRRAPRLSVRRSLAAAEALGGSSLELAAQISNDSCHADTWAIGLLRHIRPGERCGRDAACRHTGAFPAMAPARFAFAHPGREVSKRLSPMSAQGRPGPQSAASTTAVATSPAMYAGCRAANRITLIRSSCRCGSKRFSFACRWRGSAFSQRCPLPTRPASPRTRPERVQLRRP